MSVFALCYDVLMKNRPELTHLYLKKILEYAPETGLFQWRVARNGVRRGNGRAGSIDRHGHRQLRIDGKILFAHRLAWYYTYGAWPNGNIDHINGIRDDNRLINLRVLTQALNCQNQRRPGARNTSGFLGVTFDKNTGKWLAQIKVGGRNPFLGRFRTPEEAAAAYITAKRIYHPACTI